MRNAMALLQLPTEVRLLIWHYAYGGIHIPLYQSDTQNAYSLNDCIHCKACSQYADPEPSNPSNTIYSGSLAYQMPWLTGAYTEAIQRLLVCKMVYYEAIDLFRTTLTLHIRSSEAIPMVRQFAPPRLRQAVSRVVLYIHFTQQNEMAWYIRLLDINNVFPGLRHLAMNYHMRPPASYNNLANAIYVSMPLMALKPPFNTPLYVETEDQRSETCVTHSSFDESQRRLVLPCTDPRPGVTIHTAYRQFKVLFASEFLGEITTDDAIDEHTAVIRALFSDEDYIAAANTFLSSDTYHQPWIEYPAHKIPRTEVPGELINVRGGRDLYDTLLQVAHQLEKPWFEKLQKRKVVEMYMGHRGMTREAAEDLMERQILEMGEEGVGGLLELLIQEHGFGEGVE